jgi:nifR3 family TIM-barrel protein
MKGKTGRSPFEGALVGLAPLAGWSDAAYRLLCFEHGADFALTEMISADGLVRGGEKTAKLLERFPGEGPVGVQLFGSDPAVLTDAASIAEKRETAFIDLNFGCPVKKVIRKNGGAALMRDLELLGRICSAVSAAVGIPVTAKIRSGWNADEENYIEAGKVIESSGASAVTLHPRYRAQGFSGMARWEHIAKLREALSIPVVANGDVWNLEDFIKIVEVTGCETVMIGRGALGRPWIFEEIKAGLCGGVPEKAGIGKIISTLERLLEMEIGLKGERVAIVEMRKHYGWFLKGIPGIKEYRSILSRTTSPGEVGEILEELGDRMERK